jgi:uncharacterized protein YcsI (UPF0317 family)
MSDASVAPHQLKDRARQMRRRIRNGEWREQTSGLTPGIVQGNVTILPTRWADDFLAYCRANPRPCPLIAVGRPGSPALPVLGADIDIRTDLPMYCIFKDGEQVAETQDIAGLWRDDLTTFVFGCSYSFEEMLLAEGIPLRHLEQGTGVPVYRSNIEAVPAGPFGGTIAVSMRAFAPGDVDRVIDITNRFPLVHGSPVHIGDPAAIGIADLMRPDWGDVVPVIPGEVPVFWACGVTPQLAIASARPDFAITHKPSHMLITDLLISELAGLSPA